MSDYGGGDDDMRDMGETEYARACIYHTHWLCVVGAQLANCSAPTGSLMTT